MRTFLLALCCAVVAALATQYWFNPAALAPRDPTEARQELASWVGKDADLGSALAAADTGDVQPLTSWVNRAGGFERQRLLRTLLVSTGNDTPAAYRSRHRLRAFLNLTTGDTSLDFQLDNALAYILVAGCDQPTAQDLATAGNLLKPLEEWVQQRPVHEILDTVGCIRYQLGNYPHAIDHFSAALKSLEALRRPRDAEGAALYDQQLTLYRRRLESARKASAGTVEPLPKDWPTAASTTTP